MLEPMTPAGRLLLIAQHGSDGVRTDGPQRIADLFAKGFAEPQLLLPALTDEGEAKRVITEAHGGSWVGAVARGGFGIVGDPIRQRVAALRS